MTPGATVIAVPIRFHATEPFVRHGEPVTCGIPLPKGAVTSPRGLRLAGPSGRAEVCQTAVLDRWPDGSIRWCLLTFAAATSDTGGYRIEVVPALDVYPQTDEPETDVAGDPPSPPTIDTGALRLTFGGRVEGAGASFLTATTRESGARATSEFKYTLAGEVAARNPLVGGARFAVVEQGPVRWRVHFASADHADGLQVFGYVDAFATTPVVRVQLTIRNTRPARHPGGSWDLGDPGSILLRDATFAVRPAGTGTVAVQYSPERGRPFQDIGHPIELFQESSGGENWAHPNHLNRARVVPHRFRGYRLTTPGGVANGLRATPIVTTAGDGWFLGLTMPDFWENFPKAVEAGPEGLALRLFPGQSAAPHELQGGEQKTHVFYVAFGRDGVTAEPMAWCRSPLLAHADPEWYAATGAVSYLTPAAADPNTTYLNLANQAVDGPDTFTAKREVIDEYGWRHFGDVYGDHEAVFHEGSEALISHYNNQFDVVGGLAIQFLRSGNPRWWNLLLPAADHTCDIDIYHTDGDKAAYNRGLFWPTFHYNDADTSTHRSYPLRLRTHGAAVPGRDFGALGSTGKSLERITAAGLGGGPSASHNYNAGLMLAYFLTGNPVYRETAVDLARFVIDMDAPRRLFRLLSGEYSGLATASGSDDYHGPGRAAANSVDALLVGHRLTGDPAFLAKAEQLIRRVVHPRQDLDALDLLNAELRWYYTMLLQAIGQYLDHKAELGQLDGMYAYARQTLLHYARWMTKHERPVLEEPEKLQYPTETWAAQDMRKVEVFQYAARHAAGDEKTRFLERAEWFFRYVERTLAEFPTKSLCRPVVLMMTTGWSRAWWQRYPDSTAPAPAVAATAEEFGDWRMFVPQKTIALRRAKRVAAATALAGMMAVVWRL